MKSDEEQPLWEAKQNSEEQARWEETRKRDFKDGWIVFISIIVTLIVIPCTIAYFAERAKDKRKAAEHRQLVELIDSRIKDAAQKGNHEHE